MSSFVVCAWHNDYSEAQHNIVFLQQWYLTEILLQNSQKLTIVLQTTCSDELNQQLFNSLLFAKNQESILRNWTIEGESDGLPLSNDFFG